MNWQSNVPNEGTEPETQLWSILDELVADKRVEKFVRNDFIATPFRDYPIQYDSLVDDVLVIEVQGVAWHVRMKTHGKYKAQTTRARKDHHKFECFSMMGLGVLWLYDDELNKASIPKYRSVWRPAIKSWIVDSLACAKVRRRLWLKYMNDSAVDVKGFHPDLGVVSLRADARRV